MAKQTVFKLRDGFVDPNGKPVKEDGTPLEKAAAPDDSNVQALQAQVDTLTKERDEARANALPEDARDRLIAVKGVGETLADACLTALKG